MSNPVQAPGIEAHPLVGLRELLERPLYENIVLTNPHYTLLIYRYLFGQLRIMLTDKRELDPDAPPRHGGIVQQMCTYDVHRATEVVIELWEAAAPLELARSWARTWNCDSPGGRIRLDNKPGETEL